MTGVYSKEGLFHYDTTVKTLSMEFNKCTGKNIVKCLQGVETVAMTTQCSPNDVIGLICQGIYKTYVLIILFYYRGQ